jgi:hypothetical protein
MAHKHKGHHLCEWKWYWEFCDFPGIIQINNAIAELIVDAGQDGRRNFYYLRGIALNDYTLNPVEDSFTFVMRGLEGAQATQVKAFKLDDLENGILHCGHLF